LDISTICSIIKNMESNMSIVVIVTPSAATKQNETNAF